SAASLQSGLSWRTPASLNGRAAHFGRVRGKDGGTVLGGCSLGGGSESVLGIRFGSTGGGGEGLVNSATDARAGGAGGNKSANAAPYSSQTVTNSAATIGPTINPSGQNSTNPPSVETRITMSGSSVSLPTSHGRKKLSTEPTTNAFHTNKPMA